MRDKMEEYIDLFEKIIEQTIPQVDYIDIRAGKSDNTSILMKDGNIDEINTGMSLGARIRVLKNGAWGFAYTTDISKLNEITDTAIQLSNSLTGDVELSESEIVNDKVIVDVKIPFKDISIEEKKEIMKDADEASAPELPLLRKKFPIIVFIPLLADILQIPVILYGFQRRS